MQTLQRPSELCEQYLRSLERARPKKYPVTCEIIETGGACVSQHGGHTRNFVTLAAAIRAFPSLIVVRDVTFDWHMSASTG